MSKRLRFLGRNGSPGNTCPTLYETEDSFVAQGWRTNTSGTVEIPHVLLGYTDPETYLGSPLVDSGRGTFLLSGTPVTDPNILAQLEIAPNEAAVEVPRRERRFYGEAVTG
ncbi:MULTISPECIES: hypothetical protein [unclassified Nocardia]|uniref:hypothetical protein n=1 Tax=unclassified Nocardia TaxID=2637762 RepID=UPI00278C4EDF|nr:MULTISPECIES: hypothetical protein [unclassified Nocardia]